MAYARCRVGSSEMWVEGVQIKNSRSLPRRQLCPGLADFESEITFTTISPPEPTPPPDSPPQEPRSRTSA